jgi:hypothetical protein
MAIRKIHNTITNPRNPLELLNSLISANHYACRTLEELESEYSINVDSIYNKVSDMSKEISKLKKQLIDKKPEGMDLAFMLQNQKHCSRDLLLKLYHCYQSLKSRETLAEIIKGSRPNDQ